MYFVWYIQNMIISHGHAGGRNKKKHPMYNTWCGMKHRCNNKNHRQYHNYGGRGITYIKRWESYNNFLIDMGKSYREGLTLDRIDNNGNYSKSNCRWVTRAKNNRNRRDNIKYNGECAAEASRRLGGNRKLVESRLRKGWPIEQAFTIPYIGWGGKTPRR